MDDKASVLGGRLEKLEKQFDNVYTEANKAISDVKSQKLTNADKATRKALKYAQTAAREGD